MGDFVVDAASVAAALTYVAPGYLAQLGYRAKYPAPERSTGQVFIVSIVLSLPLVAVANALLSDPHWPNRLGYVLPLTVGSFVLGYLIAVIRGHRWTKTALGWVGYLISPEGSIYAHTLKHMSPAAPILVEFKDGRRVSGTPRIGPESKDDGIAELYLTNPQAQQADGKWYSVGEGVIIPLAEISNIVLSEEPTGAASS